jgi:hypothetical protein
MNSESNNIICRYAYIDVIYCTDIPSSSKVLRSTDTVLTTAEHRENSRRDFGEFRVLITYKQSLVPSVCGTEPSVALPSIHDNKRHR